jgi:isoleucyl-tRNA synthetase
VADELNVKEVTFAESADQLGGWRAKPDFKVLGPRLGSQVKEVAAALEADDGTIAAALARGESVTLATPSGDVALHPSDIELVRETRAGWGLATEGRLTVALELELTDELRREGLAREIVRLIQDARKAAGLEVTDRIALGVEATGEPAEAVRAHGDYIMGETLATSLEEGAVADAAHRQQADLEGSAVVVTLRRA